MDSKLRILVLAQYFPPDMGGGSTRASNIVKGLQKKNCDITVVAAFPHYPHGKISKNYKRKAIVSEQVNGVKVYRVWIPALPHNNAINRLILHFCFVFSSLFALPFVGGKDVVWGANPNLFSFFPSHVYSSLKNASLVRNVDDLWPEVFFELGYVNSKLARKALHFMAWLSYASPKAITPISEGYKQVIVSKYGISSQKVHVIEVGVENNKVSNKSNTQNKGRFTVMYSGVLGLGYDFEIILQAAEILQQNSNILFVIRGVGEKSHQLKKAIKNLKLNNIVLDTRYLQKEELQNYLNSADVFVLPMASFDFVEKGLPTKIFEYQSYGKPILCISNGEAAKYIKKSKSGIIVSPKDSEQLVESVKKLYSDSQLRFILGANGREYVGNLTTDKIGEKIYNEMISLKSKKES
jgi:colanic acid biosynthesis glycosyl transferase WcaI